MPTPQPRGMVKGRTVLLDCYIRVTAPDSLPPDTLRALREEARKNKSQIINYARHVVGLIDDSLGIEEI